MRGQTWGRKRDMERCRWERRGPSHLQSEREVDVGLLCVQVVHLALGRRLRREVAAHDRAGAREVDAQPDDEEVADEHVEDHPGTEGVPLERGRSGVRETCLGCRGWGRDPIARRAYHEWRIGSKVSAKK